MHQRAWVAVAVAASVLGTSALPPDPGRRPSDAMAVSLAVGAAAPVTEPAVLTEQQLRTAWADPFRRRIDLGADITLRGCVAGDPVRESPFPVVVEGHGHVVRQTCFEQRLLRQDGTGHLELRDVTLTRGGADGPGAAVTSRGEITILDSVIKQNLSEEPGGGVFSMRRVTVHRSRINGNLANDDGGGIYARRGGVAVYDSVLSNNLVDGSGGAIASTGDVLVVRSEIDGNTTDGDGGALYADEDGDVTVVGSIIDGSNADGPGGAIFTLDGDVAVLDSTLIGNRADDRGGAVSGESDVLLVNTTVARNLAVAHAGGGIWARGNLMLVNSTVTNNYAEGEGGGTLSAGRTTLLSSTITRNIASVGGDVGAAGTLTAGGTIIGPPTTEGVTGDTIPTRRTCRVYRSVSLGHNFVSDDTCELDDDSDAGGEDPRLAQLEDDPLGFVLLPQPGSPVLGRIPAARCVPTLPDEVPAGHLLAPFLDWDQVLRHDAVGTARDDGGPCDVGAVEHPTEPETGDPSGRAVRQVVEERPHPAYAANPPTDPAPAAIGSIGRTPRASVTGPRRSAASGRRALQLLDQRLSTLKARAAQLQGAARRYDVLRSCATPLDVDRIGDRQHRWGLPYDERDGTGTDTRTALAPHVGSGRSGLQLLALARTPSCLSRPVDPHGSGAAARVSSARRTSLETVRARLRSVQRQVAAVLATTRRFDAWESCLSPVPVTEHGDERQDIGFLVGGRRLPAIDVDTSDRDDPDYQLLGFVGDRRPGRTCRAEPGEAADRLSASSARVAPRDLRGLRRAIDAVAEDVADLAEPVDDISRFDECLYTVGLRSRPGYAYRAADGSTTTRSALSFDLDGDEPAAYDVMAFPGEEPPQIECNEDAGGPDEDDE